ncbi:MAG: glycosyltransferase [Patescibacteria group bacterium]
MTPGISVIIPVFNHAEALTDCLRSLETQTVQDFEIIIVDDGSAVPVANATIRFEKNRGAPAARNEGFRRSKGEYVIFLDADAVLRPDALEKMMKALESHPEADFVYPSFRFGWKTFKGRPFDEKALQASNYIHTSALIRRAAFPGFDESLKKFQDWDLFLTMAERGPAPYGAGRGSRGIWIDEVLFSLKAHGTMSNWLPSIAYRIPWPIFGWTPRTMKSYREAERIIREKHGLPSSDQSSLAVSSAGWLALILLIEALSVFAVFNPAFSSAFAVLAGITMFVVTFVRPEIGFAAVVAEHVIGSKGRSFAFGADASHDGGVSLRIILFSAFFAGWLVHLAKAKRLPDVRSMLKGRASWVVLGGFVLLGVMQGWMRQNPFLVADANAWGAFLFLLPALDLAQTRFDTLRRVTSTAAKTALAWVSAKTLALFYFFSHDFGAAWEPIYLWVRRTGVGEVTRIIREASVFRVFFQSHVYQVLAMVGLATQISERKSLTSNDLLKALAVFFAVILISFSRSFWIGLIAGFFFIVILRLAKFAQTWRVIPKFALGGVGGLLIVFILFMFPFPPSSGNLGDAILARADIGEDAAQSRWELLPVLNAEIAQSPLIGYGFGKTATYRSSDPRVVEATGGEYTTYAFEWGWHDMAMKIGLLGVLAYLWVIGSLLKRLGPERRSWQVAILTLCIIHIFTPYLNHPLGILVLVLAEALDEGSRTA